MPTGLVEFSTRADMLTSQQSVQQVGIGLRFIRNSDVAAFFPSALSCGQDVKNVVQHYLPCDPSTGRWILDSCFKHDIVICSYWKQDTRDWRKRIHIYKVSKAIAKFEHDDRPEPDTGGSGREGTGGGAGECSPRERTRGTAPWHTAFEKPRSGRQHVPPAIQSGGSRFRGRMAEIEG